MAHTVCVRGLTANLLSASQLISRGNSVIFNKCGCEIFNSENELLATAKLVDKIDNTYKLDNPKVMCLFSKSKQNVSDLSKMRNGIVDEIIFEDKFDPAKECVVCFKNKQTREPFKNTNTRASELLEIVHSDLCFSNDRSSIGGSKLF